MQLVTLLFFQKTFSGGEGMVEALSQGLPYMIDGHLERADEEPLEMPEPRGQVIFEHRWQPGDIPAIPIVEVRI